MADQSATYMRHPRCGKQGWLRKPCIAVALLCREHNGNGSDSGVGTCSRSRQAGADMATTLSTTFNTKTHESRIRAVGAVVPVSRHGDGVSRIACLGRFGITETSHRGYRVFNREPSQHPGQVPFGRRSEFVGGRRSSNQRRIFKVSAPSRTFSQPCQMHRRAFRGRGGQSFLPRISLGGSPRKAQDMQARKESALGSNVGIFGRPTTAHSLAPAALWQWHQDWMFLPCSRCTVWRPPTPGVTHTTLE
jgi:hypothetical protein